MPGPYHKPFEPRVKVVDTRALNERLRSCYGISSSECSEIKETLAYVEQDIADYDAEMHRMRLRREGLKQYAKKLSTLLSPIRRLPNELLIRIFEECCEQNDLTEGNPGSALTISAVCTRWHALSISRAALWSSFKLYLADEEDDEEEWEDANSKEPAEDRLASTVELYLKRSQNHPLVLDLEPIARGDNPDHRALVLLAQQSVRWKSLSFRGWGYSPEHFPCLSSLALPLLQTARFYHDDWNGSSPDIYAPKVTELVLDGLLIKSAIVETFSASWNALTHLDYDASVSGPDGPDCFKTLWKILDLCPKLVFLALQGLNDSGWASRHFRRRTTPKTLSSVSSFMATNNYFCPPTLDTLECFLSSLTLPELTDLTLEQYRGPKIEPVPEPYTVLNDFLVRSQCSLTSLTMNQICLTDKELVSLLLYHPSLQKLSLTDPSTTDILYHSISNSLIQSLHTWQQTHLHRSFEPLVPNLRSLILKPSTLDDFDSSSFVETISSRWLPDDASNEFGVVCLRSVELHLPGAVTDTEIYDPLRRFDAAGLRVVVKCEGIEGYLV